MRGTPGELISQIAAGTHVLVRDEQWMVQNTQYTKTDGLLVNCVGTSLLVKDVEASFVTNLDRIEPLRPEDTVLVADDSPNHRQARLYLESVIRKTPVAAHETSLAVSHHQLLDRLEYQRRAAHKALTGLRPRLLIADAVGLGKTLEVGLILSELIRRGRGERILVVTPRHILEQFQHELWTRFAIPLVRLDSEGIQRIRREIPANRNPFTHFKRAIISIDTLKNVGTYGHHLENIRWDAVVIDECHSLVNRGTLNNRLARTLAPRTEALLLTSATPHNGDPESFAELIRLLDPTAVIDPDDLTAEDIEHLYVRRHKKHDEVAAEVGHAWADRKPPNPILVTASPAENALFDELADTWTHPVAGKAPTSGKGRSLFPWTLFKAALSSHRALLQTIEARRKTLAAAATDKPLDKAQQTEDNALDTLAQRAAAVDDQSSSKLQRLLVELKEIGVGPNSDTRVVVFSERIATLDWLTETVPAALKIKPKQVRTLHGGMADVKQMNVIEEFGLAESDVKILFTGDMASEGVNLHRQCNHMIHFDLPWSLITIEQRNGRIDRYGQLHSPDIRALVLKPEHDRCTGDVRVLTRLLEREHEAHAAFGDSGSLLGLHSATLEEEDVAKKLAAGVDPDSAIPAKPEKAFDLLALLAGGTGLDDVPTHEIPSLFAHDNDFVDEALRLAFDETDNTLDVRREDNDDRFLSLVPPGDLAKRFRALPQSYLSEQRVVDRLRVTGTRSEADRALKEARDDGDSQWPSTGYLSPLHPMIEWLVDKVLSSVGRNEAPVLRTSVDRPTFAILGSWANGRGRPQLVEWMAVSVGPDGCIVSSLFDALERAGVHATMANPGTPLPIADYQELLDQALVEARKYLGECRADHEAALEVLLQEPRERLEHWQERSGQKALLLDDERRRNDRRRHTRSVVDDTTALIDSMRITGEPLFRVVALLAPGASS